MIVNVTPSKVVYQVGGRSTTIQSEELDPSIGGKDMVIYAFTLRGWNPPHENEPMTAFDKKEILSRLKEELAEMGFRFDVDGEDEVLAKGRVVMSVQAGQACVATGYWFTPARVDSRRRFSQGEVMPDVGGDFGTTVWQWDEDQS